MMMKGSRPSLALSLLQTPRVDLAISEQVYPWKTWGLAHFN